MSRDDDLEQALDAVANGTEVVARLRNDTFLFAVLKSFKKKPKYIIDIDGLQEQIKLLDDECEFGAFMIEGAGGLSEAATARADLRAVRSRLVAISRSLRDVQFYAQRVYRVCAVRLRESEDLQGVTPVKRVEDIISLVLREVHDVLEGVKLLLDEVKEALSNVDEKSKSVDAWFSLHRQYMFLTFQQGPPDDDEKAEARPQRKLGSQRRGPPTP